MEKTKKKKAIEKEKCIKSYLTKDDREAILTIFMLSDIVERFTETWSKKGFFTKPAQRSFKFADTYLKKAKSELITSFSIKDQKSILNHSKNMTMGFKRIINIKTKEESLLDIYKGKGIIPKSELEKEIKMQYWLLEDLATASLNTCSVNCKEKNKSECPLRNIYQVLELEPFDTSAKEGECEFKLSDKFLRKDIKNTLLSDEVFVSSLVKNASDDFLKLVLKDKRALKILKDMSK